ncbi:uncharacterized protein B0I36DRAFT_422055 [Microdochium trichocladiopsis]|uniref:Gylcosyl hydrolase 115 C-terminal domain-containing protein n=1 Tax=Microdochium trichocladiopsis TaxID=1682393 RepID=A0A9P8YAR6_9PEZI|nr:uncharacterized protein B0I36DRAFT_422055 [Microdochium trichocladiopsis]KAH7033721.1 hypothetical protein B0I36DRAFT_422055 [Microdochium trichocladiopsis]
MTPTCLTQARPTTTLAAWPRPRGRPERALNLVHSTTVVDQDDFVGVKLAAAALVDDLRRVSSAEVPPLVELRSDSPTTLATTTAIIVGTIESSSLIRGLVEQGLVNVEAIKGKWECFATAVVDKPQCLPGCERAFVVAGSDKRGATYGIYTLTEQIGVSPWHWWADVPVKHHDEIFALPHLYSSKEPSVKFRGIFINDEAPALTGLVLEKFGKYGKEFHVKVFDLLLRLKANFMWPAMWPGYPNPGSSFFADDDENQKTADDYGIVMSTSHHEPMQRATNEWFAENERGTWSWLTHKDKITQFFDQGIHRAVPYESYFTMGMRGEYDVAMDTDDPAAVIQDVINTQRSLIGARHGRDDAVPQLLALYKEVQEYYDAGKLVVPEDVTLLFADDNFGSIRRLPSRMEQGRKGGAGIYYHFEYVGHPRSYKWINSNSLGKTWHQLQEAHARNARQIWVFNVGDIKPLEVPLTFAMALAWDITSIAADGFSTFYKELAVRDFGNDLAPSIAASWDGYDRLVAVRRHEHIEANTFSLLHYSEADMIESEWRKLVANAQLVYDSMVPEQYRACFFELVLHPLKASFIYNSLRINQARNQLWASQRRNTANKAMRTVLDLFDEDFSLSEEFHQILGGKWNQIMRQTHYGFNDTWHAPSRDMISGLCYVQARQDSNPVVGQLGVCVEGHTGVRPGVCNEESDRTHPSRRDLVPGVTLGPMTPYGPKSRWFELYTRGSKTLEFQCSAPTPCVRLSIASGRVVPGQPDVRVEITIDWEQVPADLDEEVLIDVRTQGGNYGPYLDDFEQVHLPINNRRLDKGQLATFTGFVESDGYVSIPAVAPATLPSEYRVLPKVGRLGLGSVVVDRGAVAATQVPDLTYDIYVWESTSAATLTLYFNMTLDLDPDEVMLYNVSLGPLSLERQRLVKEPANKGELPPGWYTAVQDCTWKPRHEVGVLPAGRHSLYIRLLHPNMILEKAVVDLGGLKPSYLGPPMSTRLIANRQ